MTIEYNATYPAPVIKPDVKIKRCCMVIGYDKKIKYSHETKFVPFAACKNKPEFLIDKKWYCELHKPA